MLLDDRFALGFMVLHPRRRDGNLKACVALGDRIRNLVSSSKNVEYGGYRAGCGRLKEPVNSWALPGYLTSLRIGGWDSCNLGSASALRIEKP